MSTASALLDSNVIIAAVARTHQHHAPSAALFAASETRQFAVAAHSYAEALVTLTRRGAGGAFQWPAEEAWSVLQSVVAETTLLALTPGQTLDTVRSYAEAGNIGPRLYDRLIGEVAVLYAIPAIVTWNLRHMTSLFPELRVQTPAQFTGEVPD